MDKIELLAPAGNIEALKAAVENGADAVYLGGKLFNARQNANNFAKEELKRAVKFAHQRNVKIYITLNILLANEEINSFIDYVYELAEAQVDAFIVQDLGIAYLLKNLLPNIPLHASTQMAIHNYNGIKYLEDLGFKRVVLAREVSLENIALIRKKTKMELEIFVHGALCIAYSGQCLMSSLIGGRSGNRGCCAQPCRLKYQLIDLNKNKLLNYDNIGEHLLSPKDINMIRYIPDLIKAGVTSFKIEGRMKRPEYVATVVKNYRQAINNYYKNPESFNVNTQTEKELEQIFNRDFTTGHYLGNQGYDLMSYKKPNNRGILLGRVIGLDKNKIFIKLKEPLNEGDGYEIWVTKGGRIAGKVREIYLNNKMVKNAVAGSEVGIPLRNGCPKIGDRVFKTHDTLLIQRARESYSSSKEQKETELYLNIDITKGKVVEVKAGDSNGNNVVCYGDFFVEEARKHSIDKGILWEQFSRLGNTPFKLIELKANINGCLMVPLSELNQLRRTIVDKLLKIEEQKNIKAVPEKNNYIVEVKKLIEEIPETKKLFKKPKLSISVGDVEGLKTAVDSGADQIYLNWVGLKNRKPFNFTEISSLISYCQQKNCQIFLRLPRFIHEKQISKTKKAIEKLREYPFTGILVGNLGTLQLAKDLAWDNIGVDYSLNIFNDFTIKELLKSNIKQVTFSPELTLDQIRKFSYLGNLSLEVIVHGNFPLMISEYCVIGSIKGKCNAQQQCYGACANGRYGLRDRMNYIFPIETDNNCRMLVYNSKPLNLYNDLDKILKTGIDLIRIEGRKEDVNWIRKVTEIYRYFIDQWFVNRGQIIPQDREMNALKELEPNGYTTGHFFRGVL